MEMLVLMELILRFHLYRSALGGGAGGSAFLDDARRGASGGGAGGRSNAFGAEGIRVIKVELHLVILAVEAVVELVKMEKLLVYV